MTAETDGPTPSTGRIFITGGTGFVGGNIRAALGDRPLRLLVRSIAGVKNLESPTVELVEGDVTKPETLHGVMDGCNTVIHLTAIIAEEGGVTFDQIIRQGSVNVIDEAKRSGVERFIDMSAMGATDNPQYPYLKAKWDAEQAVKRSEIPWTIFRPSVIFGPGDGFINVLANLVKKAPIIPVVGSGQSKFQPVSVKEVATAFVRAVDDPATAGETYELGGPDILTYEELLDIIAGRLGKKKPKVHVPVGVMKTAVALSRPLPKALRPPVTEEQLRMLALDNCTDNSATSRLIGREPIHLRDGIDYIVAS
jgi:uncharacterized protein YbjT (DUF2867 family)